MNEPNTKRMQDALKQVTGQNISIRFEVDRSANAAQRVATDSATQSAMPVMDRKKSLQALPLFKKASDALGAQIWHVDDDFNPIVPPRPTTQKTDEDSQPTTDEE